MSTEKRHINTKQSEKLNTRKRPENIVNMLSARQIIMPDERPPCFSHGGYDEEFKRVFVQFSDGSIYEYQDFTLEEWVGWKDAYPRGTYFNHTYRWTAVDYQRLKLWPPGLTYTF